MKVRLMGLGLVALVLTGMLYTSKATTFTNRGDVITVTLLSELANTNNGTRTTVPVRDFQVIAPLTAAIVTTAYTPRWVGDMLLTSFGATNYVLVSKGNTTNDWIQVAP